MTKMSLTFLGLVLLGTSAVLADGGKPNLVSKQDTYHYTWVCRNANCTKTDKSAVGPGEEASPIDVCKLNCDVNGVLFPLPTGKVELGKSFVHFYPQNVEFGEFQAVDPIVRASLLSASDIFRTYLLKNHPDYSSSSDWSFPIDSSNPAYATKVLVNIAVALEGATVKIGNDESYTLDVSTSGDGSIVIASIIAQTYFGARHGLETLSQLIAYNGDQETLSIVNGASVEDKPFFVHRGIMMDTARNFISIPKLRNLIDGLSYNKLNVFHWHITDTHSFPFFSKSLPQMTAYGAYSPKKIYTTEDMIELVEYARVRGVKVLPEFDEPAHVGNGWEWGPSAGLGNLAVCVNQEPWYNYCVEPPCGQLNPTNENIYTVLGSLFQDFIDIFGADVFHMGGDEVNLNCWNTTEEITSWMAANGMGVQKEDFLDLWSMFQDKAYAKVKEANGGNDVDSILWTSELASKEHILKYLNNKTYIIQIWTNGHEEATVIPFLIENGYRTIFTNVDAWYLDCGYGGWIGGGPNNWCSPYKGWQQVYGNNPIQILADATSQENADEAYAKGLILGGEAALWSEQVDEQSMEAKIWPRGAALGERLWTNPATDWSNAEIRMVHNRQRLVQRGLQPDRLQPEWCHQNERQCYGPQ